MGNPNKVTSVVEWLENITMDDKEGEIMGLGITNGAKIIVERVQTPPPEPGLAEVFEVPPKPTLQPGLKEFTVFPKLPIELRLKIWRLTIPGRCWERTLLLF